MNLLHNEGKRAGEAILSAISRAVAESKRDFTFKAQVAAIVTPGLKYTIQYEGTDYALSYNGTLTVGDTVIVCAPRYNMNDLHIVNPADISSNTIMTMETYSGSDRYPLPSAGDSLKTILGKIVKFGSSLIDWIPTVCLTDSIVNHLTSTQADAPLSAAQGKVLMDLYTQLNSNLTNLTTRVSSAPTIGSTIPANGYYQVSWEYQVPSGYRIFGIDVMHTGNHLILPFGTACSADTGVVIIAVNLSNTAAFDIPGIVPTCIINLIRIF